MCKVSVIIPVYNAEKYLRDCLDSIINQTLCEIEIICINDGSTDKSLSILDEYASHDERVLVFTQENSGTSSSYNEGLFRAKGKYIYIIDNDDMLDAVALEELYDLSEQESLDILFFDAKILYDMDGSDLEKCRRSFPEDYYIRKHNYSTSDGLTLYTSMMAANEFRVPPTMYLQSAKHVKTHGLCFKNDLSPGDELYTFQCTVKAARAAHLGKPFFTRRLRRDSITIMHRGFQRFHAYLYTFMYMLSYVSQKQLPPDVQQQMVTGMLTFRHSIINIYSNAAEKSTWFDMLSETEQAYAKSILFGESENYTLLDV
ncbi:MAG: glycosyltransferase [Oscillospiraceae bacterium]|nr:glycosyltransferase [Oscillospiraceae bacterium]